jgi:cell division protein FtsW (lipid II flippase)
VSLFSIDKPTAVDEKQTRLIKLAAVFLLVFSILLTISPAVRLHSWDADYRWQHWIGFVVWMVGAVAVHHQIIRWVPDRDPFIFPVVALLSGWGLLTIWRLDLMMGMRQTIWLAVSLLVLAAGLRYPGLLVFLRRYKYLWLTSGLLLTALTFLFGTYPGGIGPPLWLGCCGIYLQPSEPLKLLLIIYLAAYLADRIPVSFSLGQLLTPTLILGGTALALLGIQQDLGTASLFILIYSVVVYLASNRRRMLLISLLILLAAVVFGYSIFDVVRIRVDAWINPWLDPSGRSYQIVQSLIAIASGELFGQGPGLGSPGVVPVSHSDFIYASIVEETGLLGAVGLLLLFALIVRSGFRAAINAVNNYQRYLAAGITAYVVMQAILIIGGNLRLLPLTGVTLPFVSYGGSSLLTTYIAILLLILISNRGDEEPAPLNTPLPYLVISAMLLTSLLALALVTGWWSAVRSEALLVRTDNPRRGIAERFVSRGALLDRESRAISITEGSPGSLQRRYMVPSLSATTGYNSLAYGQAGLEAGLDSILRGLEGNSPTTIWLQRLMYGQPPPGLDVQLTINLDLQQQADELLSGRQGALVLLNASTGEILAISSHPHFDPNNLGVIWNDLIQDPNAPLLNRATQGRYPPGPALGPFLLGMGNALDIPPPQAVEGHYTSENETWECAREPRIPPTPARMIANGCPAPLVLLAEAAGAQEMLALFTSLGFYEVPSLPLLMAAPAARQINQLDLAAIGQENLSVTPLQMALAAAAMSNNSVRPAPQIVSALRTPEQGWVEQINLPGQETLLFEGLNETLSMLAVPELSIWQTIALARSHEDELTWFIGGTLPASGLPPLALALVLEERNPDLAELIGQALLSGR